MAEGSTFDKAVREIPVRPALQNFIIEAYDHGRKGSAELHAEVMAEFRSQVQRPKSVHGEH